MLRPYPCLVAAALSAAALPAQCLTVSGSPVTLLPTTTLYPVDDEGRSAPIPLGFAFPIGAGTYTHVSIESNGVVYLTNGAVPTGTSLYGSQDMGGQVGDSPRLAGCWSDLEGVGAGWGIFMDTSVPGLCKITWQNVNEYFIPLSVFTAQLTLSASGVVDFTLSAGITVSGFQITVGASEANGIVAASSDLSTGPTTTTPVLYEDFVLPNAVDISNLTTTFVPSGAGYLAVTTCTGPPPATHTSYGSGCYSVAGSFYELFPASTFDLGGSSMSLLAAGNGYVALPAITTFVPPPASATALTLGDDTDTPVTLTGTFPYPGGATSTLVVCSNGFVSAGLGNSTSYVPDIQEHLNSSQPCWRGAWHDLYPLGASGLVKFHQTGSIAYVTWDGVYSYGTTTPETFQMQFDLATGSVHVIWVTISGQGNDYLVGYAPAGPAIDPGSTDISAALPTAFSIGGLDLLPLTLSASPTPVSTPTAGTVVTYTTDNMRELAPGLCVGITIFSVGAVPAPGLDLGFLGAPGCAALVQSLDMTMAMVGLSTTQSVTLSIPPGVPLGSTYHVQSTSLFPPNSLPNGQNAFGILTSNGITSFVSLQ